MRQRATLSGAVALAMFVFMFVALGSGGPATAAPDAKVLPSPTVHIVPQKGFYVRPCPTPGPGCTEGRALIPVKSGYDYAGLRAAGVALRKRYQKLRALTLVPSGKTRMDAVLKTMAHLRRTAAGKKLFPVIILAMGSQ